MFQDWGLLHGPKFLHKHSYIHVLSLAANDLSFLVGPKLFGWQGHHKAFQIEFFDIGGTFLNQIVPLYIDIGTTNKVKCKVEFVISIFFDKMGLVISKTKLKLH